MKWGWYQPYFKVGLGGHKIICSRLETSGYPILVCISKTWGLCWKSWFLTPSQPWESKSQDMGPRNSHFLSMFPSRFRVRWSISHTLREHSPKHSKCSLHFVKFPVNYCDYIHSIKCTIGCWWKLFLLTQNHQVGSKSKEKENSPQKKCGLDPHQFYPFPAPVYTNKRLGEGRGLEAAELAG